MANRIRISQIIPVDIAVRIHIPRIVIAVAILTVTHEFLYQDYLFILYNIFVYLFNLSNISSTLL